MKISDILKSDFVISDLGTTDKQGTLTELCRFLADKGVIQDRDSLLQALLEREKLGSTGIGDNVAIPHAKIDDIDQITIVFARSPQGIEFEALDQKPVHFVCLLLAPNGSTGQHLKALARIARLFKNEVLREAILKAAGSSEIYSVLLEEDSKF